MARPASFGSSDRDARGHCERMRPPRALAALLLFVNGCSVMSEVPRDQYAQLPLRRNVRVTTPDGKKVRLIQARFTADSLLGEHRVDRGAGPPLPHERVSLALDQVARLEERHLDWYRTGIVAGVAVAAAVTIALTRKKEESPPPQGGGKVP